MPQPDMKNPVHFLAFGLGSGMAPIAPGTFGTLAAIPLWWLASRLPPGGYLVVLGLVVAIGPWLCGRTAKNLGVHDHPGIVWDEFAGFLLTMVWLPVTWGFAVAGFVLFRLFDVLKPWPIGWLDRRIPGGAGIMVDDLVAGLYAALALQLGMRLTGV